MGTWSFLPLSTIRGSQVPSVWESSLISRPGQRATRRHMTGHPSKSPNRRTCDGAGLDGETAPRALARHLHGHRVLLGLPCPLHAWSIMPTTSFPLQAARHSSTSAAPPTRARHTRLSRLIRARVILLAGYTARRPPSGGPSGAAWISESLLEKLVTMSVVLDEGRRSG
jgi:hypothetical protein